MATLTKFEQIAEFTVTCSICFEFFVDQHVPKDLECSHTCCQICLQTIVTLNPGQPITCPMKCEKKTRIPVGGIEKLRTNLHLKNLAEEHPNYVKGAKPAVPKCTKHKAENMHLYCLPCNKLACHSCCMAYHQGSEHKIVDVGDKAEERKHELKGVINEVEATISLFENSVSNSKKIQSDIVKQSEAETEKLLKAKEELIKTITLESKRLEDELQRTTSVKLDDIRRETVRLQNITSTMHASCDVAKITCGTSDYAYITQHNELVEKMKKIAARDCSPRIDMNLQSAKFESIEISPTFGRIVNLVEEFGNFEFVAAMGSSKHGLLAVSDMNGKQVSIYQKQNGKYEKKLPLELNIRNKGKPCGVIFCPNGKIWVARVTGIDVYSPDGKYEKTISTKQDCKSDAAVGVYSLAITKDGSRILAGDGKRNIITIHDTAGKIIRTLKTSIRPCRMAVIKNTHVVISDWKPGKVSVIDIETGCETVCVDVPWVNAVCYDNHTDSIFTGCADDKDGSPVYGTGKIEQYCRRTGRKIACLAKELFHPTAMTMASDNTLVVVDEKSVKIFEIA